MDITTIALLALVILFSYFVQSITGFGASVFAIALGALFMDARIVMFVISIVGSIFSIIMILTDPKGIDLKEYGKIVLLSMLGIPFGLFLFNAMDVSFIQALLACVMLFMGVMDLLRDFALKRLPAPNMDTPLGKAILYGLLFIGGVLHGATTAGGPVIIIYAAARIKDKRAFKQTMSALWVVLNAFFWVNGLIQRQFTTDILMAALICLPFLLLGVWLGGKVFKRISQRSFTRIVNVLLVISGLSMLLNAI